MGKEKVILYLYLYVHVKSLLLYILNIVKSIMDQGALIELVQQYDHIYNKKHGKIKNKLTQENAITINNSKKYMHVLNQNL